MAKFLLAILLLVSISTRADIQLRSLKDVASITLSAEQLKNNIFVVFQPNCVACKKQLANLNCLNPHTKIRLLGAFASEQMLRSEYRKMASTWPGYYADKRVLQQFSVTSQIAPQTLVYTTSRVFRFLGYTECDEIKKAIDGNGDSNNG